MHATRSLPTFSSSSLKYRRYLSAVSENQLKLTQSKTYQLIYLNIWAELTFISGLCNSIIRAHSIGLMPWTTLRNICAYLPSSLFAQYSLFSSYSQMKTSHFKTLMTAGPKDETMHKLREMSCCYRRSETFHRYRCRCASSHLVTTQYKMDGKSSMC